MNPSNNLYVIKASAGTGKTYTLAAHYIALLMNGQSYRSILAVTFTNKATAEMKERILTYLHAIARETELEDVQKFLDKVREVSHLRGLRQFEDKEYATKAESLMKDILADYDNMKITTIDSFLQLLLGGMAQALGQAAGYAVDLDLDHNITLAIDQVLTDEVVASNQVRHAVVNSLNERLNQEEKWDLRPQLIKMARKMYDEQVQKERDHIVFPSTEHPEYAQRLADYKAHLDWRDLAADAIASLQSELQNLSGLTNKDIVYGSDFISMLQRMRDSLDETLKDDDKIFTGLNPRGQANLERLTDPDNSSFRGIGDAYAIQQSLVNLLAQAAICRKAYLYCKLCREHINDLMLVGYVIERIRQNLKENNTILLVETACTLAKALQGEDASFILMKAGIRYRHIMLDEFQDTSTLQWQNFRLLVAELISQQGGSALIVGDVKQSIYRWRNGDYRIMDGLEQDPTIGSHYHELTLTRNFRSLPNITRFVNTTFYRLAAETSLQQHLYKEVLEAYTIDSPATDKDGFIGLWRHKTENARDHEANEQARNQLLQHMYQHIEEMLRLGYEPKDILILVRYSSDGKRVLRYFADHILGSEAYPLLTQAARIESVDSYLLEASIGVNVVISALRWYHLHDQVAKAYLQQNTGIDPDELLTRLQANTPLYDLVEQIIAHCLCQEGSYCGQDIAHINCLKDKLRTYIGQYGSDIQSFINYWDDTMHLDKIPVAEGNAIRLMTIHSAKGLEAKNVFLPFCNWPMNDDDRRGNQTWCSVEGLTTQDGNYALLPISLRKQAIEAGFQNEYSTELASQRIDNLNLLYVALTRPEHNLFVYVYDDGRESVGTLLFNAYARELTEDTHIQACDSYLMGKLCRHEALTRKLTMSKPFSFANASPIQASYSCQHADISFRQSRQTRDMLLTNHDACEEITHIEYGNLCHAIMEKIRTKDDLEHVLEDFRQHGAIPDHKAKDKIHTLISKLLNHPIASEWFDGQWHILREETVLIPTTDGIVERRMDRMMWLGNRAIILDYKFGIFKDEYPQQVRDYMQVARLMGFTDIQGYLWMAFQNRLIPITE